MIAKAPSPFLGARALREALDAPAIDTAAVARDSRAIFLAASDAAHARWIDLELTGYGALSDVRPLHEILGLPSRAPLIVTVTAYRTQVGRRWGDSSGGSKVAHFFVEPLEELAAARDRVHDANVTGRVELSFAVSPSAPRHPASADFPADVFDRILLGFALTLKRELTELAP